MDAALENKILDHVKDANKLSPQNTGYRISDSKTYGEVTIHTVTFIGGDQTPFLNFVREAKGKLTTWNAIDAVINDLGDYFVWKAFFFRNFQTVGIFIMAILIVAGALFSYAIGKSFPGEVLSLLEKGLGCTLA